MWSLVDDEEMLRARKGRQRGKMPLDEESVGPRRGMSKNWDNCSPSESRLNKTQS